jgi:Raf kinase inhibitor-like YbhB/YbcL family protein
MTGRIFTVAVLLLAAASASAAGPFKLRSSAFDAGEPIPTRFSCDGKGISPPLAWSGVPKHAKSLALIVTDPDAPGGTFVHWVLYDLPADKHTLAAGAAPVSAGHSGINSRSRTGYTALCPPSGTHHYHFRLYALDTQLHGRKSLTKQKLLQAMQGHIISKTELIGTYRRR